MAPEREAGLAGAAEGEGAALMELGVVVGSWGEYVGEGV